MTKDYGGVGHPKVTQLPIRQLCRLSDGLAVAEQDADDPWIGDVFPHDNLLVHPVHLNPRAGRPSLSPVERAMMRGGPMIGKVPYPRLARRGRGAVENEPSIDDRLGGTTVDK